MAVLVRHFKDLRRDSNNLWYYRAVHPQTIDLRALAKRIQANVSVKESDVYAVLIELVEVMRYELSNGNKLLLDRLGYFYPSVKSVGSIEEEDLDMAQNIQGGRVKFLEQRTVDAATGMQSRSLCDSWSYKDVTGLGNVDTGTVDTGTVNP